MLNNIFRRDFRLLVADPNTGKPIPHPVIWESSKTVIQTVETSTEIKYQVAFLRPSKTNFLKLNI